MLAEDLTAEQGQLTWSENSDIGYMPQDVSDQFDNERNLFEWLAEHRQPGDDDQTLRSVLGRLLFSADDIAKKTAVLSGGEKNRLSFGRLMLGRHNVLLLDEPTNHLDMESIESLQMALEKYKGTLIVVSHDREFISGVATRILEVLPNGQVTDFVGDYEAYVTQRYAD